MQSTNKSTKIKNYSLKNCATTILPWRINTPSHKDLAQLFLAVEQYCILSIENQHRIKNHDARMDDHPVPTYKNLVNYR